MNSNRSYETPGQYSRGYRSRGYSNRGYSNRGAYSSERKKLDYVCIEEQIADTSVEPSSINIENHFKTYRMIQQEKSVQIVGKLDIQSHFATRKLQNQNLIKKTSINVL